MALEIVDANEPRERHKWGEDSRVYTRKKRKEAPDAKSNATANTYTPPGNGSNKSTDVATTIFSATVRNNNTAKDINNEGDTIPEKFPHTLAAEEEKSSQQQQALPASSEISILEKQAKATAPNGPVRSDANEAVKPILMRVNDRIKINLSGRTKNEIRDLKKKFVLELDQVWSVVKKLENEEVLLHGGHSKYSSIDDSASARVYLDMGSVAQYGSRPFQPPSVAIRENNTEFSELGDREKRTPKANQLFQNSKLLLGKDRLPPEMSSKRWNLQGGKKRGRPRGHRFGVDKYLSKAFKGCNDILTKLMKHKHGWLFDKPVDVETFNSHDYHDMIKSPMDLGTIKARLLKHLYKSPIDFAEDVRLTFYNAMTYNPKGHEVHGMAEELLKIFQAKLPAIESDYNFAVRDKMVQDIGLPTPTSRPNEMGLPTSTSRPCDTGLTAPTSRQLPFDPKLQSSGGDGKTPALKKPKARDLHKRNMTYDEKQNLTANLQSLPLEKLVDIVQIFKKRNLTLSQHDDEIELDLDSVDAETLWELDRFALNFKKKENKEKRKTKIALQPGFEATPPVSAISPAPSTVTLLEHSKIGENSDVIPAPDQGKCEGDGVSRSSSPSSSSSDSGSSSSDSDSDDSSSNGSEGGGSPKT